MDQSKQALLADYALDDFRSYVSGSDFQARGFYDYGRQLQSLRIDQVTYTLRISPSGEITGSSNDSAGSATITGSIDFKDQSVRFVKKYGIWNLWATWTYVGRVTEDGRMIWGQWFWPESARTSQVTRELEGGNGRFGMWIGNRAVDHEKECLEMLLWMHGGLTSSMQEK